MADRMAILSRGKIDQIGTPEEIYRAPGSAGVAQFIGETNLIEGEVVETGGGHLTGSTVVGTLTGRVTDAGWKPAVGEKVVFSVRPEAWRLHQKAGDNGISGTIAERAYLGQRIQYWISTPAGRLQVVEMNPHEILAPGEKTVRLHARRDDVVVLKR